MAGITFTNVMESENPFSGGAHLVPTGLSSQQVAYLGAAPPGPMQINNPNQLPVAYVEYRSETDFISPRESYENDKTTIFRKFLVPWDARFEAVKHFLGYPIIMPYGSGANQGTGQRYISRYLPLCIPWLSTIENGFAQARYYLWCMSAEVEGKGDIPEDGVTIDIWQTNRCGTALVTCTFGTPTYDIISDTDMVANGSFDVWGQPDESFIRSSSGPPMGRYVTIDSNPSTKYQTLPAGSFVVVAGNPKGPTNGVTYPGTPGRLEVEADFSVTHHSVPMAAVPFRLLNPWIATTVGGAPYIPPIEDCLGCVNKYDFAGCHKGTLLLVAAVMKRIRSYLGERIYDIEFRFKWFGAQTIASLQAAGGSGSGSGSGAGAGVFTAAYGHNLVLVMGQQPGAGTPANSILPFVNVGYYEVVSAQPGVAASSNYALANPVDNINIFPYRPMDSLFRVPQLMFDPGNT